MSYRPVAPVSFHGPATTYPMQAMKLWTSSLMSASDGSWSLDITAAGFQNVLCVQATAQTDTTNANSVGLAVIRSYSNTRVTGWVMMNNTGTIFLGGSMMGLKFATAPVRVFLTVIGL
jgi:hypothetical protein